MFSYTSLYSYKSAYKNGLAAK